MISFATGATYALVAYYVVLSIIWWLARDRFRALYFFAAALITTAVLGIERIR